MPTIPPVSHNTMRVHCHRVSTLMSRRNASTIKLTTLTTTKEYTHTFMVGASAFAEPIVIKNDISKPTKANKMLLLLKFFIFIFFFFFYYETIKYLLCRYLPFRWYSLNTRSGKVFYQSPLGLIRSRQILPPSTSWYSQ